MERLYQRDERGVFTLKIMNYVMSQAKVQQGEILKGIHFQNGGIQHRLF
jgi:hypothetical protein